MQGRPPALRNVHLNGYKLQTPIVWLGQSVDTSVLFTRYSELGAWPVLTSLGDAMRRPRYIRTHFNENLRAKLNLHGPIMVDSGGYVLMTRKVKNWTVDRVAEVYRTVDADVLVSLDHPPVSTDTFACKKQKRQLTISNLRKLAAEFQPDRLMPVIHGITLSEIEDNCAAVQAISSRPRWIGIGGLVPLLQRLGKNRRITSRQPQRHFSMILTTVRKAFPHSLVHVFGAGAPRSCLAAFALGAHSADSQAWRQAAGFGSIYLPGTAQRILEWNRPHKRPRPLISEKEGGLLASCSCPACRPYKTLEHRIDHLKNGFEARSIHNAWVLDSEVRALRIAILQGQTKSFLESRLSTSWLELIHIAYA